MLRRLWTISGAGLIGVLLVSQAQAGLLITAGDISLDQGGSGYVPVTIQSTAGTALLDFTAFQFQINTASGRLLEFQDSPYPDPTFGASNYVFFGNSADQAVMSGLGTASDTSAAGDTFIGGDFTADGTSVMVSATSAMLLVDLPVTAVTALAGDVFTISLVPLADASPGGLDGNTGFSAGGTFMPFTSQSGTVTIMSNSSVPEPGSLTLTGSGALALLLGYSVRRQRRRA